MTLKFNNEAYETRPFECWPVMKELRNKHFWKTWQAQERGDLLVLGMNFGFVGMLAGFGDFANPTIGTHFTRLARTPNAEGIIQAVEAAEAYGLGRDVCGAMKSHVGQLFQGLATTSPLGGNYNHDFAMNCTGCHSISKSTQIAAEYVNAPFLMLDVPHHLTENSRKYLFTQLADGIEWIEKTTGKKCDDEKMIEGVKNEWYCAVMWARCVEVFKNIPTPASMRTAFSLRLPFVTGRHNPECRAYVNMLYDELEYRAANKITDHKFEKLRLNHENLHPLYRADMLRSPELYGAVFVAGVAIDAFAIFDYFADGSHAAPKTLEERGIELKTREDALNSLVDLHLRKQEMPDHFFFCETVYKRAMDWHADAVVLHYDRPCQPFMCNYLEARLLLQEKGMPVGVYSSSQGDPRDFDERRILGPGGELPTFYESLGLKRLENVN